MPPVILRTQSGKLLQPGRVLGKGGEATVYHVEGDASLVAKLYTDGKAAQRLAKVQGMVAAGLQPRFPFAAFPMDLLFSNNQFVGFTMRKVVGAKPLVQLTIPSDRKAEFPDATFRFLVRTALNLARVMAALHSAGIVVGDINESGALVDPQGMITVIDADSFQYRTGLQLHCCIVGKAEYTPPELQGLSLSTVERTVDHDAFGLAVLIFELLFMGRHPFAGISKTSDQPTIAEAIKKGRFAYSPLRAVTMMEPPPFMPVLADIPIDVAAAFQRAFGPTSGIRRQARLSAADWVPLLASMESGVVECQANPAHLHSRTASSCPWCRLEAGWGTLLFVARQSPRQSTFNPTTILERITSVTGPGPAPDLMAFLQGTSVISASSEAVSIKNSAQIQNAASIALGVVALLLTLAGLPIALVLLIPACIMVFRDPDGVKKAKRARIDSDLAWNESLARWNDEAGPGRFDAKQHALLTAADRLRALPTQEQDMLLQLDRKKEQLQLRKHLESARIAPASIDSIGDGRKAALRSFGVETAWDLKSRPLSVPGFGPVLTEKLKDWQVSVERRFRFNPNIPTDPAEVARVKSEIGLKRTPLESELVRGAAELEALKAAIIANRQRFAQHESAYRAYLQAQADAAYLS